MERRLTRSEVVDAFVESQDVIFWTRMWAKNVITDAELIEHLKTIHDAIDMNAIAIDEEGLDGKAS